MNKVNKGFTLVELMITVAIVGLLAAIAVPSYSSHVTQSRRVDAQGALISLGQAMERYYTEKSTYVGATLGAGGIFPNEAPLDAGSKYYDLSITTQTSTTFTVQATPKNAQAGDGNLTFDNIGTRGWDGHPDGWD
jgi:type IV pilus assembly protein PilE